MTLPTPPARKEIIMAPFAAVLTRLMRRPWYPGLLQWLSVLFFVPVVGYLLFGPADKDNPANLLVWLVWWPLLCVLFLVAGRFWCGICPFSKVSDGVRRLVGLRRAVPDFLKEQGGWLILIAFILLSWLEETRGILDSPRQTAILLLSILTGAIVFSLFFQGRVWCRYVCPIGGLSQVYSRAALFKVRPREDICADCTTKDCMVPDAGYAGCPMHLSPFAMESVTQCNLCGGCVKRCQHGSLQLRYEAPAAELTAESPVAPVVLWLIPFLAGLISLLNALESGRLPLEGWLEATAYPVLIKTLLMALALGSTWWLLRSLSRLAASANPGRMSPDAWLALGARPLIPLLLLSHLGHVGAEFWQDGGHLLGPLARVLETPGLALPGLWGADWTAYANALCILLGLVLALALLGWTAFRAQGIDRARFVLAFGAFYLLFAGWNLYATWPLSPDASLGAVPKSFQAQAPAPGQAAAPGQSAAPGQAAERVPPTPLTSQVDGQGGEGPDEDDDGWSILWLFIGLNAALLALALILRRERPATVEKEDFSATKTWNIRDGDPGAQGEVLSWLVEQAVQARWRVPAAVSLANAAQEVISFLRGALPPGSKVTVLAILRKNKGVMTISHTGKPLALPDYRGEPQLDDASEEAALAGIELRLAAAQIEHLSYHARMSDNKGSFSLRHSL